MLKLDFSFLRKHLKKKLFNKIFFIYSIITIFSLFSLSIFITKNLVQTSKYRELDFNKQVLDNINNYLTRKYNSCLIIVQQIYVNKNLSSDLIYFLTHDYVDYHLYRLDNYSRNDTDTMTKFQTYFDACNSRDEDINSIILCSKEKKFLYITSGKNVITSYLEDSRSQKLAEELFSNKQTYYPYLLPEIDMPYNKNGYNIISGINNPDTQKIVGSLIINYNVNGIYKAYEKFSKDLDGYIIVLTRNGDVLFDSSNRYYGSKYPYFHMLSDSPSPQMLDEKSFVNVITSPATGAIIAGIIPERKIASSTKLLRKTILIITLLLLTGSVLSTYLSMSVYSKRTGVITGAMKELQNGNLSIRIPPDNKEDELTQIAYSFNSMCDDLNKNINKVYVAEIKQKNAELVALQSQINPHFLYNTLEVIRMKAISRGIHDVGAMIYTLAALFRNTIKKEMIISISDEIELCNHYLELFRIRYKERLAFEMDIDDEIMKYSIVRHVLQPIIENCIAHGFNLDSPGNIIMIEGCKIGSDIHILIRDNGTGIKEEKLCCLKKLLGESKDYPSSTIGLANVNERLKIIYGDSYGLDIDSEANNGTMVLIKIPAKRKEEINNVQSISG